MDNKRIQRDLDFLEHLEELRKHLLSVVLAFAGVLIIAFIDQDFYMKLALYPHQTAMTNLHLPATIQVLRYEETFLCYLQVSFISALILTTPFFLYKIWLFCEEALEDDELNYLRSFLFAALVLFIGGVLFGYFMLIPLGLQFLASYGGDIVQIGFTLSSYLSLFFVLTFVAGITFELPLVMLFLVKIGWVSKEFFIVKWKYSVFIVVVLAAVLTPPDFISQLLLAIPMIILYFTGIFLCQISEKLQELKRFFQEPVK